MVRRSRKSRAFRELNLEEGGFTAELTIAEAARKAIEIKGGNCSENSKVTFSILASQPRTSQIHIVKATDFDHQYVVIGDDLSNLERLVVADSWPEFPVGASGQQGLLRVRTAAGGNTGARSGQSPNTRLSMTCRRVRRHCQRFRENTFRQIKINKLYKSGAYAQLTSLKALGTTYRVRGRSRFRSSGCLPVIESRGMSLQGYLNSVRRPSARSRPRRSD